MLLSLRNGVLGWVCEPHLCIPCLLLPQASHPHIQLTWASTQPLLVSCLFIGHLLTLTLVPLMTVVVVSILEYGSRALLVLCEFSLNW